MDPPSSGARSRVPAAENGRTPSGAVVPIERRDGRPPIVLSAAAAKSLRQRMLFLRQASVDRVAGLVGLPPSALKPFRHELAAGDLPETLLRRGAGPAFLRELPHGSLLYLMVRALRPRRVVETGVRPGYSTAWLLAALEANGAGELVSLGPGSALGRATGVHEVGVGQFVPPSLRSRWTLVLGNTEDRLRELVGGGDLDLFFYDNGPDAARARFELGTAWPALSSRGVLLAHRVDANAAWDEFCRRQGMAPQILDAGPPPMGGLAVGGRPSRGT